MGKMGMPKSPCNRPSVSGGSRGLGIWARLWNNHGVCQSCLVWKWGIPRNGDILREFEVPKLGQSLWKLKFRKACWRKSHVNGKNIYSMSRNRCNIKAKNRTKPNRVGQVGCNWKWGQSSPWVHLLMPEKRRDKPDKPCMKTLFILEILQSQLSGF